MIAARLAHLRVLLDARAHLTAGRDAAEQLAPVVATLAELDAGLSPVVARYRLLRDQGVPVGPPPDVAALLRGAGSLHERITAESVTVPKPTLGRFRNQTEAIRDALREQTARAWSDWAAARTPFLSEDDLRLAELVEGYSASVAEVRALLDDARRVAARPPDTAEAFAAARDVLDALRAAVARLPDVSADPEVSDFLRAVGEGGATLAHVTPRVIDWLGQRGRADQFVVGRAAPATPPDGSARTGPAVG